MRTIKPFPFLAIFILHYISSVGQQGVISGKILDESSNKVIGFATVAVYRSTDTSLISYRLSTQTGDFRVPGLPINTGLRLVVTHAGFEAYRQEFELNTGKTNIIADTIRLIITSKNLDEVVVIAELPPIVYKKDTIEFNATAFRNLPNALVEDLLKKLPGVEVDRDGNISFEGRPVNRILVDGKSFFGDDSKIASKNLPANIIDKVQVTDDKDEIIRRGDDNPNEIGKVINLTFKKGVKKGWFGRIYGGAGNKDLYNIGGIGNIFRDTLQVSVLGYANNINKAPFSFSELLSVGGFQRNRSNSTTQRGNVNRNFGIGTGISIDNINFGGTQGQGIGGIITSKGTGFNLNHAPDKRRSLYLQYFYNRVETNNRNINTDIEQIINDTVIKTHSRQTGPYYANRHNVAAGFRLLPDSVTNILFNVAFTSTDGADKRLTEIKTTNNFTGNLSNGIVDLVTGNDHQTYKESFLYTHLSKKKKGRRYTIGNDFEKRDIQSDNFSNSINKFYYPAFYDTSILQLRKEIKPQVDLNIFFNYSEPLSKKTTLRLNARYDYLKFENTVTTFNYNGSSKSYDIFNPQLSNGLNRRNHQLNANAGIEYRLKNVTLTPGLRLQSQKIKNELTDIPIPLEQNATKILPSIGLVYKTWNLYYNRNVILPDYSYLIPVADNSNPYYITLSNPDLLSSINDQVWINYRKNVPKKQYNYGFSYGLTLIKNDIVSSVFVGDRGVFATLPVNKSGTRYNSANVFFNKQFKRSPKFTFSSNHSISVNSIRSRLIYNNTNSWQYMNTLRVRNAFYMNLNDKFEWNGSYAFAWYFSRYSSSAFENVNKIFHELENEFIIRYPKHFIWETNIQYYIDPVTPGSFERQIFILNTGANHTFLKDERAVLKFEVVDLFDTYKHIIRDISRNLISTRSFNVLGRYFMLSFTYNIQKMGNKNKVGGWRSSLF